MNSGCGAVVATTLKWLKDFPAVRTKNANTRQQKGGRQPTPKGTPTNILYERIYDLLDTTELIDEV